jgi:ribonuclease T
MASKAERYISVDVETSGPIPGEYSLLSIGACVVGDAGEGFLCLVKPISRNVVPEAVAVTGLDLDDLEQRGLDPQGAMESFRQWIQHVSGDATPVFVGLNAPFDWSFVNYYFQRFLRNNPFGFSALDIKSLYMGATGCSWADTRSSRMVQDLNPAHRGDHDALNDARAQAELFELTLKRIRARARR